MNILNIQYGNLKNSYARGGSPNTFHESLKRLTEKHTVTCLTGLWPDKPNSFPYDKIIYIQKGMGQNKYLNRITFTMSNFLYEMRYSKYFDLILIQWDRYAPVPRLINAQKCPVILVLRSDFLENPSKFILIEPLARYLLKRELKKCRYLIACSRGVQKQAAQYTRNLRLSTVVTSGIPAKMFSYSKGKPSEDYLLFLGRLDVRQKGIDILITAYERSNIKIPLKIAGDGQDKIRVERMVRSKGLHKNIEMTGWVEGSKKIDLLKNCLAVCVPSRSEGFGTVPLEAAAMGKPVIGTNVGGLEECVVDGETGLLVKKDNIDEYSEALKKIVRNKSLRYYLGKNAKVRARDYTWEKIAKEEELFFQKVKEDFEHTKQ
jgi:glycosyltransferase involved in cell wall biosynthesis